MTGPKLNEGARVAGERPGTRATARYIRTSASKVRLLLDLIRGLPANQALDVLKFSERGAARDVIKVLDSAIANAVANDLQDPDELYVSACFADEGPTLRRFRPRARGRATRIRKRTCHITVIVDRMSDEELEVIQQRESNRGSGGGASARARRERVERSRQRAQALREQAEESDEADDDITDTADLDDTADDEIEETVDTEDEQPDASGTEAPSDESNESADAEDDNGSTDDEDK